MSCRPEPDGREGVGVAAEPLHGLWLVGTLVRITVTRDVMRKLV